ncbi:putative bifunctional diguanylate cyclase/phosphodiesterase [Motilibacter aurantiacus]|uniref:putative bifunctional diguanylate cyclase/phosphodiesterase n=1 Tax=Motilibacter aurantiacus TaxID=2714955 RepID=UPI00140CEDD7|nr:EAL domain-containing protein [Motilibacter aurantiacus]NHC43902.1 EAL domain-containing protein [Motilibacter aurantiacus]
MVGVGALGAAVVDARLDTARNAKRAERSVQAVVALSSVRSMTGQETLPSVSMAIAKDATLSRLLGLVPASRDRVLALSVTQVTSARKETDAALARARAAGVSPRLVATLTTQLAVLRGGLDTAEPDDETVRAALDVGADVYHRYERISQELTSVERAHIDEAIAQGLSPEGVAALDDLGRVSDLVEASAEELGQFLATSFARGARAQVEQRDLLTDRGAYEAAAGRVDLMHTEALRAAWNETKAAEPLRRFELALERTLRAATDPAERLSLSALVQSYSEGIARDTSLVALLDRAAGHAIDVTGQQRSGAMSDLRAVLGLSALLLLLALGLLVAVEQSVSRPLRRLAADAEEVSRGRLVQVHESGPSEVRTVARALATAVASLRRVQGHAEAVARGELDDERLREPLTGPLGSVVHASIQQIVTSIRQRETLQVELAFQAAHDALTELPNRAQGLRHIAGALHRAERAGATVALLFVDLDHFKRVNDTFGHAAGDEVLRTVSRRMQALVRSGDVVCRLGGDEFLVLVEPVESGAALLPLAHRLIEALCEPIAVGDTVVRIGASIGVAVSTAGSVDADALLREADAAAYRAKTSGRGTAEVFDEGLRRELAERAELEAAITRGLAAGEFVLHYQPVVSVATRELRGFEALLRWERPGHGLVPPAEFIPLAEQSNLICDLGRWALAEATRQLAEWSTGAGSGLTMAVNISARHLASPRIVDDVADALAASGLDPSRLVVELTETIMADDPACTDRLAALRARGVRIAIDDFGTGYTSIGQLQHLPVDTLKIDRSFVASSAPGHRELVRLIVSAAHAFDLAVVAEGVEEDAQLAALVALDCDSAQGYLIARPMTPAAVAARCGLGEQADGRVPAERAAQPAATGAAG